MRWFGPSWGGAVCTPEQRHELLPATLAQESPLSCCALCQRNFGPADQGVEFLFYAESPVPSWQMRRYHLVCFFQFLGAEAVAEQIGPADESGTTSVQFVLRNVRPPHAAMERVRAHRELEPFSDEDDSPEWPDDTPTD